MTGAAAGADPLAAFEQHRRLLFTVAYQMLGSVADAEDVVQDAWLRWSAADRDDVADPRAYLVRTASRLALDRLTAARTRRETYVGPWLPEPLLTDEMVAGLRDQLGDAALVELTMMVAVENQRSRFNSALGLTSQGFKDRCEIPAGTS